MKKLTDKQRQILTLLSKQSDPLKPTEIGEWLGKRYQEASSWACSGLKPLVAAGYVCKGGLALYTITDEGREALKV